MDVLLLKSPTHTWLLHSTCRHEVEHTTRQLLSAVDIKQPNSEAYVTLWNTSRFFLLSFHFLWYKPPFSTAAAVDTQMQKMCRTQTIYTYTVRSNSPSQDAHQAQKQRMNRQWHDDLVASHSVGKAFRSVGDCYLQQCHGHFWSAAYPIILTAHMTQFLPGVTKAWTVTMSYCASTYFLTPLSWLHRWLNSCQEWKAWTVTLSYCASTYFLLFFLTAAITNEDLWASTLPRCFQ